MQKLVELEGITGTEVKAEEEPKDETIVGSGGEALRPPGINIFMFFKQIFSLFGCIWTAAALW